MTRQRSKNHKDVRLRGLGDLVEGQLATGNNRSLEESNFSSGGKASSISMARGPIGFSQKNIHENVNADNQETPANACILASILAEGIQAIIVSWRKARKTSSG